jgi:hypothetical protein
VRLVTDDDDLAVELLAAEGLGGVHTGQRGADDGDPA